MAAAASSEKENPELLFILQLIDDIENESDGSELCSSMCSRLVGMLRMSYFFKDKMYEDLSLLSKELNTKSVELEITKTELLIMKATMHVRSYIDELEFTIFPRWLLVNKSLSRDVKWQIGLSLKLSRELRTINQRLAQNGLSISRLASAIVNVSGKVLNFVEAVKPRRDVLTESQWEALYDALLIYDEDDKQCLRIILAPLGRKVAETDNFESITQRSSTGDSYVISISFSEPGLSESFVKKIFQNHKIAVIEHVFINTDVYILVANMSDDGIEQLCKNLLQEDLIDKADYIWRPLMT